MVAVIDTGIDPADPVFADSSLQAHPSTYISGFPASAQALAPDAAGAVANTLYYVPGTRVVGTISFGQFQSTLQCPNGGSGRVILDDCHHGSKASARAAAHGANVLIVGVEVASPLQGLEWALQQPWIDVISLSWGTIANAPIGHDYPSLTKQATDQGKVVVVAAGNGVTGTGIFPDRSATFTSPFSGPSWVVSVGAGTECQQGSASWDYWWHSIPADVAGRSPPGGGTSMAAPVVAGGFGRAIADARAGLGDVGEGPRSGSLVVPAPGSTLPAQGPLADGVATRLEVEGAVQRTAVRMPTDLSWLGDRECGVPTYGEFEEFMRSVQRHTGALPPSPADLVSQGYGLVDAASAAHAGRVLLGRDPMPARNVEDTWMQLGDAIRDGIWGPKADPMPSVHAFLCQTFPGLWDVGCPSGNGNSGLATTDRLTPVPFTSSPTDPDGQVVAWLWRFGDGSTSTQQNPSHLYGVLGTYPVELRVTDDDGIEVWETVGTVTVENLAPAAHYTADTFTPYRYQPFNFYDQSTDADGSVVSWVWNFGDGTAGQGKQVTKLYPVAGTYTVTLTVVDGDGATASVSKQVVVQNGIW